MNKVILHKSCDVNSRDWLENRMSAVVQCLATVGWVISGRLVVDAECTLINVALTWHVARGSLIITRVLE